MQIQAIKSKDGVLMGVIGLFAVLPLIPGLLPSTFTKHVFILILLFGSDGRSR